jgi:hypothetical protein
VARATEASLHAATDHSADTFGAAILLPNVVNTIGPDNPTDVPVTSLARTANLDEYVVTTVGSDFVEIPPCCQRSGGWLDREVEWVSPTCDTQTRLADRECRPGVSACWGPAAE